MYAHFDPLCSHLMSETLCAHTEGSIMKQANSGEQQPAMSRCDAIASDAVVKGNGVVENHVWKLSTEMVANLPGSSSTSFDFFEL